MVDSHLKVRCMPMFLYKDMKYYDIVRQNIRKYRLKKKYTQQVLADKSNLSVDYICEIESSTKNKTFSIRTVGRIADALNMELYEFFKEWIKYVIIVITINSNMWNGGLIMKKTIFAILVCGVMVLGLTGCGKGTTSSNESEQVAYTFDNLKQDLTTLDSSVEVNEKSASLVGATEGYGYSLSNCTIEVYKYDKKSEQYKKAEKEQKISMPSFEMTFDAVVNDGYAYTIIDGDCEEVLKFVDKLN